MRFDPQNPYAWIDEIVVEALPVQLHLRILCMSLYSEDVLVRLPQIAVLGSWGMNADGPMVATADAETNPDPTLEQIVPPKRVIPAEHRQRYNQLVAAEQVARPNDPAPSHHAAAAFKFAGGTVPPTPYGTSWKLRHLYDGTFTGYGDEHFYGAGQQRINALRDHRHYTQSAGMVALHPIANQLWTIYPWIAYTLRARAAVTFRYDPDRAFLPGGERDGRGFAP